MKVSMNRSARARRVLGWLLIPALLVPGLAGADEGRGHDRGAGHGYDRARVISAQPVYERVTYSVPQEVCRQERVAYREPQARSATGPILGAIIGGALGNAVGHGNHNKRAATAVGAVLGGTIGYDIGRRQQGYETVRYGTEEVCDIVHEQRSEDRLLGYDVTYRYAGSTYSTRMDRDPGEWLRVRVQVTPVG
ncbi:MAG: glycine zipper 2TM domain-containing protein [Pseudomonadales bacterium]